MRAWVLLSLLVSAPCFAQYRAWIGITLEPEGCRVQAVLEGAPAARAGLRPGDDIVAVDGVRIARAVELIDRIGEKGIGERVSLRLRRADKEETVSLTLEARPDQLEILRTSLIGKPVPELAAGRTHGRVDDLAGKVVIYEFWATWCSACRASIPRLVQWHEQYARRGLRIVSVSSEPWATVAAHFKGKLPPYVLIEDKDAKTYERFRVPAIPAFVVVGKDGKVRHVDIGTGERLDAVEAAFLQLMR